MLQLAEKLSEPARAATTLTLRFDQRQHCRLRVELDDGREAALRLARGVTLRDGDYLRADDGSVIEVRAAHEAISTVCSQDPLALARACYHLGNRHTPLEIRAGRIRYARDGVLDQMVRGLGLEVRSERAPFDPEPGAYGRGKGHSHA